MFKPFLMTALLVTSFSLFAKDAKISTITCMVKEPINKTKTQNIKVEFLVKNLGSSKAELVEHPRASDYGAILVLPDEGTNMNNLNGQGGDLRIEGDTIRLFGDGDGYTFVDLVLTKKSNYEKGFVRVSGSGDKFYTKISCTVK
ncbi:MAG: hypothetical protein WC635_09930 [Bacteriovorax sp.]|jgi:hypothetical protein